MSEPSDPYGVRTYEIDGTRYYLDNSGERPPTLYRAVGETNVPRAMAINDGPVLIDGKVVHVDFERGLFEVYHHWMGNVNCLAPRDFGTRAVKLERVEPV